MSYWMKGLSAVILASALGGCSSTTVQHYADKGPELIPDEFFNGRLCADGIVKDFRGRASRHFSARITASWDEAGVGTLDEVFQFNDRPLGEVDTRVWTLLPDGDGYLASANDVPIPVPMEFAGNSLNMEYVLHYSRGEGDTIEITMDDWMYLVSDRVLINETRMSKFGITVGEVVLTIRKATPTEQCLPPMVRETRFERVSM